MAEEEGKKEEKFDFTAEGEVLGYISLEQARVLAMETARDHPGNYRRFAGVSMVFSVVEQEEGEDYYTVTLSFRPEGDFAGAPGREQVFIGKDGVVAHRQVLGLPKGKGRLPVPAIAGGIAVAVAAVAVVAYVIFGGGESPESPGLVPIPNTPTSVPAVVPPTPNEVDPEIRTGS